MKMTCRIDNGYVYSCDEYFYCQYACESGYYKSNDWSWVYCDEFSGKGVITGFDSPLCFKMPYTQPFAVRHDTDALHNDVLVISTSVIGGIVGLVLLLVFIRLCLGRVLRKQLARPPTGAIPPGMANAREPEDYARRQNENIRGENTTNSGIIIFRIRRFFMTTRNPYGVFRNTPEPPAYDAESFAPPTYEEAQGTTRVTTDSCEQLRETRDDLGQEPPPYYEVI